MNTLNALEVEVNNANVLEVEVNTINGLPGETGEWKYEYVGELGLLQGRNMAAGQIHIGEFYPHPRKDMGFSILAVLSSWV